MYILFSIISPVINKLTGKNLRITDEIDLDKYIEVSNNKIFSNEEYMKKNEENINNIYIGKIKVEIGEKIENKGYIIKSIDVASNEGYEINKINMKIDKKQKDIEQNKKNKEGKEISKEINCSIEEIKIVEINNKNEDIKNKEEEEKAISDKEINYLKKYLSENYNISIKNIFINE